MPYPWPSPRGVLHIGGVSVATIAAQFDTPCYVTDAAVIGERYRTLASALHTVAPMEIAYACKANTNLAILRLLAHEGCGIDAVSPGEVEAALRAGVAPERIMFTGANPRDDELHWLAQQQIWINCDAPSVVRRAAEYAPSPHLFSLRVNPGIGAGHHEHVVTGSANAHFGIPPDQLPDCLDLLQRHSHRLARLQVHIGSGIREAAPYCAVVDVLGEIVKQIAPHPAVAIDSIDIGGGLGIPYQPDDPPLDLPSIVQAIGKRFRKHFGPHTTFMMEPGRYLVAESTILLTRITTIKSTAQTTFLGVDAGFNTLLRPVLYDAYHHIAAATKMNETASIPYTICGPICETCDVLGRDRRLPPMHEGELLAIYDVGAYGFAMASTYNSRPRPAEVMVANGTPRLIRRRETLDDLWATQIDGENAP